MKGYCGKIAQVDLTRREVKTVELKAETDFSCEGASNIIIASVDPIYEGEVNYILDGSLTQSSGIFENVSQGKHTGKYAGETA